MQTLSQLRIVFEQLEMCSNLLTEQSVTSSRTAIILVDNVAEILMQRYFQNAFRSDDFFKWIVPKKYQLTFKKKIERFFGEKVKDLSAQGIVSFEMAKALEAGHEYRNAIYHRDVHKESTVGVVAKSYFSVVCNLCVNLNCGLDRGVTVGYLTHPSWLTKYGFAKGPLDIDKVIQSVTEKIRNSVPINFLDIADTFRKDLIDRVNAVKEDLAKYFSPEYTEAIDKVLRRAEFQILCPVVEDKLSEEYREYVYRIARGESVDITPTDLEQLRTEYENRYEEKLKSYKQRVHYTMLDDLVFHSQALKEASNVEKALDIYWSIDKELSLCEHLADFIVTQIERVIEIEEEIRRGK